MFDSERYLLQNPILKNSYLFCFFFPSTKKDAAARADIQSFGGFVVQEDLLQIPGHSFFSVFTDARTKHEKKNSFFFSFLQAAAAAAAAPQLLLLFRVANFRSCGQTEKLARQI